MNNENVMHHFAKCKLLVPHSTKYEAFLLNQILINRHSFDILWLTLNNKYASILQNLGSPYQHEKYFYRIYTFY